MPERDWLIREGARSVSIDRQTRRITLTTRGRTGFGPGDRVLIMAGPLKEATFREWAAIADVSVPTPDENGLITTVLYLDEIVGIPEPNEARLFLYSLTFVRNLERPDRHFYRPYRLVPSEDFASIVEGELFVSRTAYYEFLKALPEDLQIAVQFEESIWFLENIEYRSFAARLRRLREFLETRLLSVGRVLSQMGRTLGELDLQDRFERRVGHQVAPPETETIASIARSDDLIAQAQRFAALEEGMRPRGEGRALEAADVLQQAIDYGGDREGRFEQLFRGR